MPLKRKCVASEAVVWLSRAKHSEDIFLIFKATSHSTARPLRSLTHIFVLTHYLSCFASIRLIYENKALTIFTSELYPLISYHHFYEGQKVRKTSKHFGRISGL